eukprot:EG_transcript_15835
MAGLRDFQTSLGKLNELLSAGVIDDREYDRRKASLVDNYVGIPRASGPRPPPRGMPVMATPPVAYPPSYLPTYAPTTGYGPPPPGPWPGPLVTRPRPALRCHNCGAADHLVRQCPYPETCHVCGRIDHKAAQCPYAGPRQPPPVAGPPRGRTIRCHNCGAPDHLVKLCPHPEVCHNCKGTGHKVADCPLPPACHVCGATDHKVRECPQKALSQAGAPPPSPQPRSYVPRSGKGVPPDPL